MRIVGIRQQQQLETLLRHDIFFGAKHRPSHFVQYRRKITALIADFLVRFFCLFPLSLFVIKTGLSENGNSLTCAFVELRGTVFGGFEMIQRRRIIAVERIENAEQILRFRLPFVRRAQSVQTLARKRVIALQKCGAPHDIQIRGLLRKIAHIGKRHVDFIPIARLLRDLQKQQNAFGPLVARSDCAANRSNIAGSADNNHFHITIATAQAAPFDTGHAAP